MNILILGISGGLARLTADIILKTYPEANVYGVDQRSVHNVKKHDRLKVKKIRYNRTNFERVFRDQKFDYVYHLARVSHSELDGPLTVEKRLDFGVLGTQRILDLCLSNNIKKVVLLSTFHVYGALADNPGFINEDMPLRASLKYPDLRDVVEMDQVATNWMWKHQNDISTLVFRPCNIIGPKIFNTISKYLAYPFSPYPIDYNPMFQFIHEYDMAKVLVHALENIPTGAYNVAPNDVIPLKRALQVSGNKGVPVMFSLMKGIAKLIKTTTFKVPDYLIDYLMFSCLLENSLLSEHLPEDFFKYEVEDTLKTLKLR